MVFHFQSVRYLFSLFTQCSCKITYRKVILLNLYLYFAHSHIQKNNLLELPSKLFVFNPQINDMQVNDVVTLYPTFSKINEYVTVREGGLVYGQDIPFLSSTPIKLNTDFTCVRDCKKSTGLDSVCSAKWQRTFRQVITAVIVRPQATTNGSFRFQYNMVSNVVLVSREGHVR